MHLQELEGMQSSKQGTIYVKVAGGGGTIGISGWGCAAGTLEP